ncbi:MAG: hypothetical protein HY869_00340 [Chloroflexi bacterium]|nr:hypothetical protein [Chloroflexota bacterium]
MKDSLLPSFLAFITLLIIMLTAGAPLFEWRLGTIVPDIQEAYDIKRSYPWKTGVAEPVNDETVIFRSMEVFYKGERCINTNKFDLKVSLSPRDNFIETIHVRIFIVIVLWVLLIFILSTIYHFWVKIWIDKASVLFAIFSFLVFLLLYLIPIWILMISGPIIYLPSPPETNICQGVFTLELSLNKIHYDILAILFAGILAEAGATVIMVKRVIDTIKNKPRLVESQG